MQEFAVLYRTPPMVVAAQSVGELLEILSTTLRGLYRNLGRHGLYVVDDSNITRLGGDRDGSGHKLLASLKARLPGKREGGALGRACRFPALREVEQGSLMIAPLLDERTLTGLVVVEAMPTAPDFTSFDLDLLEGVAALFSLALQRLHSKETELVHSNVELELKSASRVQRGLMCQTLPPGIGVTVDVKYLPAFDVGGDFYELTDLGDRKIGGAIGDVSGKGMSAALIMSRVSSDVRRVLRSGVGPSSVLGSINESLADSVSETFVTASCIRLDALGGKLTVANAGHLPLLVRRAAGDVFTFGPPSGTPLGMMPCEYADDEISFGPHDIALLMTDGLVEALDRPDDRMGVEFLHRLIAQSPPDPKVVNARILDALSRMRGSRPLDDVTLVALQLDA